MFLTLMLISLAAVCLLFQARWHILCFPVCWEKQATRKGHRLLVTLECAGSMALSVTLLNTHLLFGKSSSAQAIIWAKPQPKRAWVGLADHKTRKRRNPQTELAVITQEFSTFYEGIRVTRNSASFHWHDLFYLHPISSISSGENWHTLFLLSCLWGWNHVN